MESNSRKFFNLGSFLQSGSIASSQSRKTLLMGWGEPFRTRESEIDPAKPAFYFPDFFLNNDNPWIQHPHWMEIPSGDMLGVLSKEACNNNLHDWTASKLLAMDDRKCPIIKEPQTLCDWSINRLDQFHKAFNDLYSKLETGKLLKGVPYLFAKTSQPMDPTRLQACLQSALTLSEQKSGYVYGSWHGSSGVLGLTPELLFSHTDDQPNKVHTMAVAGTCPLSRSLELFMKDEKEKLEHGLVVKGIAESLRPLGIVNVGEMGILQLPMLAHLMTPIDLDLHASFEFGKLVSLLHPTPALGAFPSDVGKGWLRNFELHTPRGFYGAPVGYKYPQRGQSLCFVAIRNVQWDGSGMRIGAGCGVVAGSSFDRELEEIQLKIASIRNLLHL